MYIKSSTTGEQVWSYAHRDEVINWNSDQYRTAAERFARRVEEYLHDPQSPQYMDPVFADWAVAMFDREKQGTSAYQPEYTPLRDRPTPSNPQNISAADIEVHGTPGAEGLTAAYRAGYEAGLRGDNPNTPSDANNEEVQ